MCEKSSVSMNAASLAQIVHSEGFVVLPREVCEISDTVVAIVRTQVLNQYQNYLTEAAKQQLDLTRREHAERLPGFYVREGGRIDMQLSTLAFQLESMKHVHCVDIRLLKTMAATWESVLQKLFAKDSFQLEYIGCVISRPGDKDQNWHLDGVHHNPQVQEPVDRLNVFVPLVAITEQLGGTEMKRRSHIHDNGLRGASMDDYQDLTSVISHVEAGTPILMDYRVWHRGLANTSQSTVRPLLYFKYARIVAAKMSTSSIKKRKRITPIMVG